MEGEIDYLRAVVCDGGPSKSSYREISGVFDKIFEDQFEIRDGISARKSTNEILQKFLSDNSDTFRTTSSMQGFAFSKPHGYAGDFEMIEKIYSISTSQKPDLLRWDEFFHSSSASKAVRNRADLIGRLIGESQPERFLSVGCGPALDVVSALKSFQRAPAITLLDNDPNALARADVSTRSFRDHCASIDFVCKNAMRFRTKDQFDFIWSSGLFDYLSDKAAIFLLKRLKTMMAPGAEIAIGNFSHDNPSRSYMEIVGEWFLRHRTKEDMLRLARCSGFLEKHIQLITDQTGLNIFLIAKNA